MPTREIQREEWGKFFASFNRQHAGWLTTIEIAALELGDQLAVRSAPLIGVDLADGGIEVIVGGSAGRAAHFVAGPERVWLKQADDGTDEVMEIEAKDGATLIRFDANAAAGTAH